jgi:glycosyltransferase involved in cell wall biosynthesis
MPRFDPLVSVVIPLYNGANYVAQAIESALGQTYRNLEIVVIDDGSPDGGAGQRAAEPYLGGRVRYVRQENRGVAGALNRGMREMRGDIMSWLSHDDLFLPDKTERQVEFMRSLGRDDIVVYSDYACIGQKGEHLYDVVMDREMLARKPRLAVLRGCTNGCTMLIPRKVFEKVGLFDETLRHTQDYDYWDRIDASFDLVHFPAITVHQRQHDAQDSRKHDAVPECDRLWLRFADNRGHDIRTEISGSPYLFLTGLHDFLAVNTKYTGAIEGLAERASRCIPETLVTAIVDAGAEDTELPVLASLATQDHSAIEVVVVDRSGRDTSSAAAAAAAFDGRFKRIEHLRLPSDTGQKAFARALELAEGGYVMFLRPRDLLTPTRITDQMTAMQTKGAVASFGPSFVSCQALGASYHFASATADDMTYPGLYAFCPVYLGACMFNRAILRGGLLPQGYDPADQVEFMAGIAREHGFLALDVAQTMIDLPRSAAPIDSRHSLASLSQLLLRCDTDAGLWRASGLRQRLAARYDSLAAAIRDGTDDTSAGTAALQNFAALAAGSMRIDLAGFVEQGH